MSAREAEELGRDLAALKGDKSASNEIDPNYQPKTELVARVKEAVVKGQKLIAAFEAETAKVPLDVMVGPSRLGTPAGRAKSAAELETFKAAYEKLIQSQQALYKEQIEWIQTEFRTSSAIAERYQKWARTTDRAWQAAFNATEAVIEHSEKTKATYDKTSDQLVLADPTELNHLAEKMEKAWANVSAVETEVEAERARSITEALSKVPRKE